MIRVCIAAGGTGGHILPGLAVAKELRSRGHPVHFILKTDTRSQEFLAKEAFTFSSFLYTGFPRALSWALFVYPVLTLNAIVCALRVLRRERPDVVLGMGGYISVPVGIAAFFLKIPMVIHEQNSCAGMANRFLTRWAVRVAVSFPDTKGFSPSVKLYRTGLPLRPDLSPKDPSEARKSLGLDPHALTLLVFGGSQGARALNRLVTEALSGLAEYQDKWQIIHIAGDADYEVVKAKYHECGWRHFVQPFWKDMGTVYSAADFVIGRAGAGSVMELERFGRQCLLIPFPYATNDHQETNARYLEKSGQAQVVLEQDLTVDEFRAILRSLPTMDKLREGNARRAAVLSLTNIAAAQVADLLESVLK